ncbi:unnamed protein product [Cylindrotheca closterium]|uniref:Uncharacterized protein n=1 Tax=Cylindrotheca closterium TaxID=2856 RepID=A0AAD2GCV7_9STRA|nr:unnamed protein product [Cylindrotheca closterium]
MRKEPSAASKRPGLPPTQQESGSQVAGPALKKQSVEVPQEEYDSLLLAEKEKKESEEKRKEEQLLFEKEKKELEKRLKESEEKRKESEEKNKALEALETGEYYMSYNDLWNINLVEYKQDHLDALTRAGPPSIERNGLKYYERTLRLATDETGDYVVAERDGRSGVSSRGSYTKAKIWPFDVLASTLSDDKKRSRHRVKGSQVAHLVPAGKVFASLHTYVAPMVFGLQNASFETVQKLIHGSRKKNEETDGDKATTKKEQKPDSNESASETNAQQLGKNRKVNLVGTKHFTTNMIRLKGQESNFDTKPHLLIVPILSSKNAVAWQGEGYEALFIIGTPKPLNKMGFNTVPFDGNRSEGLDHEGPRPTVVLDDRTVDESRTESIGAVADEVGLKEEGTTASEEEIEIARKLLETAVLALAHCVIRDAEKYNDWDIQERDALSKLKDSRVFPPDPKQVWVPSVIERSSAEDRLRVRKIAFGSYDAPVGESDVGHPAPDPMLLIAKAANNWAAAHRQRLLAGAEEEEDDDDMSEGFIIEMESHLGHLDGMKRKQIDRDVPGMIIEWS